MTINHLITLGENGVIGTEKFSKKLLYSLPINPRVKILSFVDLSNLMRGLAIVENTVEGYGSFGSTTVMGKLLKLLKTKDTEDKEKKINDLINWLLNNRNNPYIPFGVYVPIEVKSIRDYALHENEKYKHREEMEAENKKRSARAKAEKIKKVTEHKKRQKVNVDKRNEIIKKTKRLNIINKFKWITESDYTINFYPEEYAEISSNELEKIPKDLLEKLYSKLENAKKGSKWRFLRNIIKDYISLDKEDGLFVPNYIICPDCGNILDLSFKDSVCPNPICGFRFKGLQKYLNKNISELRSDIAIEFRGKDEHLIKLIATALKYNSGVGLVGLIKNFNNKKYREDYEKFILLYLKDVNLVKSVLMSNVIKNDNNVFVSKNGYKIFPELIDILYSVHDVKIRDFLRKEFKSYPFRKLTEKPRKKN